MDELLVFGYGCKLFRDDERAMYIDERRHLIPWMGDDRLMIDRYDGRGHLYDLSKYDAANVTVDPWGQTESERAIEAACEEERYLELKVDLAEQALYEEEEWKRYYESLGGEGYKAMGFNYDYSTDGTYGAQPGYAQEEEDLFHPPPELSIPEGMEIPRTNKENAIIEKTAKFIAEHGAQMEIMIKAKQKDNPQFEFMEHDHPQNIYFKHVVKMIRSGKYQPKVEAKPQPPDRQDSSFEGDEEEEHHGYLHPSLMSSASSSVSSKPVPKPVVRVHETPYGDLIKSVTKSMRTNLQQNPDSRPQGSAPPLAPPPLPPFMAQDVYGPSQKKLPPPPGLEPVTLPHPEYQPSPEHHSHQLHGSSERNGSRKHIPGEVSMGPQIVPPAPDIQPIIDRMALYVAKNGVDFETVVKSKNDPRFDFLHPGHMHYAYYDFRKRLHLEEIEQEKSEDDERQSKDSSKGVSFKLKTKEQENTQLDKRKAFDYESTDDEDGEGGKVREGQTSPSEPREPVVTPAEKPNQLSQEDLEKKQAEDKLKDRLALAAREKLAQASKEKQIQAERKRKAAMFITLLKTGNQAAVGSDDKTDLNTAEVATGSGPPSLASSRPGTPYDLLSGKNSPASDRPVSPSAASQPTSEDQSSKSKASLPRAYYGIPASMRRFPRSPTPPTSYSRSWRSRSRSPRRFGRVSSPPSNRWSDRQRSRSPRRFDRSSTSRRRSPSPPKPTSRRSKSPGFDRRKARSKRSRSRSPRRSRHSPSHSKSKKKKHKRSRSRSRSPSRKSKESSRRESKRKEPVVVVDLEPPIKIESTECSIDSNNGVKYADSVQTNESHDSHRVLDGTASAKGSNLPPESATIPTLPRIPQVSDEKISKVKAMLKASRKAILKEEGVDIDL